MVVWYHHKLCKGEFIIMKIILASGSPRRKELLAQAGYDFVIEVSDADENIQADSPGTLVEELSHRKAGAVAKQHMAGESGTACHAADYADGAAIKTTGAGAAVPGQEMYTIIGADTVVAVDGRVLGKPDGEEGAVEMLRSLSGRTHQVYTGVSLLLLVDGRLAAEEKFHVCTDVTMRKMSDEEIRWYVSTGEPMDKAGAYGIQGKAAVFISGIHGDYYNVVGLPLCETVSRLRRMWKEKDIHE